ncbi:MAG: hypothetical protein A4S08_12495 [Proteobacteria bacterium SG_bin4]|nr:MAG: hypothetical protein A4S08_12495 [Proteobacteria bacterium SG_bin4]
MINHSYLLAILPAPPARPRYSPLLKLQVEVATNGGALSFAAAAAQSRALPAMGLDPRAAP